MVSGFGAFIGFGAFAKNSVKKLVVYLVCNVCFGLIPLGYGVTKIFDQIKSDFRDLSKTPDTWKNSPMKMALIAVCCMWQVIGAVHAIRLIRVWRKMNEKKKD